MTTPDRTTSNYARALYHLDQAENLLDWAGIQHAIMANARATLALVEATDGENRDPAPTWSDVHVDTTQEGTP